MTVQWNRSYVPADDDFSGFGCRGRLTGQATAGSEVVWWCVVKDRDFPAIMYRRQPRYGRCASSVEEPLQGLAGGLRAGSDNIHADYEVTNVATPHDDTSLTDTDPMYYCRQ